jgi:subtilisin family serine protease
VMALAAGNSNADACNSSPSSTTEAITVGASDINDVRASFSNWGSCVDWFAPGVNITSAGFASPSGTAVYSGTSMASPHSAGAAALYLEAFPGSSPVAVRDGLYALTTKGIITQSNTTNNHLLYTLAIGSGGGSPPPSPDIIKLNAALRVKGNVKIDLSWSGSSAASVDVFRNNVRIATVANSGSYTDSGLAKRNGSYQHKVCNAGTTTCSNVTLTTY